MFNELRELLSAIFSERRSHRVELKDARYGKLTVVTDIQMILDGHGLIDPATLRTVMHHYERVGVAPELIVLCPYTDMVDELPPLELSFQRIADQNKFSVVLHANPISQVTQQSARSGIIILPSDKTPDERETEMELLRDYPAGATPPLRVIVVDQNWIRDIAGTEYGLVQRLMGVPMGKLCGANSIEAVLDRGVEFPTITGVATYQYVVVHRPDQLPTAYQSFQMLKAQREKKA